MRPSPKNSRQITPEDILGEHSNQVRQIAEELRRIIYSTVPEMVEKAYPGWHGIGFRHPRSGYICGIFPGPDSAKLLFEHGVQLSNVHGVLDGVGKQTRYVEVAKVDEVPVDAIKMLLLEAVELKH